MRVGAENKKELYAMLALMAIAVVFLVRMFLSYASPTPGVAASVPNTVPAQPEVANQRGTVRAKSTAPLDPTLRTDLLKNSEGAEYKGSVEKKSRLQRRLLRFPSLSTQSIQIRSLSARRHLRHHRRFR